MAELQNIAYNEYLPVILGDKAVREYKLEVSGSTMYRADKDPCLLYTSPSPRAS